MLTPTTNTITINQHFHQVIDQDSSLLAQDKELLKRHIDQSNYALALRCACRGGCITLVHTLFEEKQKSTIQFDPNGKSQNGNTALHWVADFFHKSYTTLGFAASWEKAFAIIKNLYLLGCNPTLENQQGLSFFQLISQNLAKEEQDKIGVDFNSLASLTINTTSINTSSTATVIIPSIPPLIERIADAVPTSNSNCQAIRTALSANGIIRLADGAAPPEGKTFQELKETFITAMTLEAQDITPECLATVLSIIHSPGFCILFINPIDHMASGAFTKNDNIVSITINSVPARSFIQRMAHIVLFHEMLVHIQSTQEDIEQNFLAEFPPKIASTVYTQQISVDPGLFFPTKDALLTAVAKDRAIMESMMQLIIAAEKNGTNSLQPNDQTKLSNYIQAIKQHYKPTTVTSEIIIIDNSDHDSIRQLQYARINHTRLPYPAEPSETPGLDCGFIVNSFEKLNGQTYLFINRVANKNPEQISHTDPDLIMSEDFFINFRMHLQNAEDEINEGKLEHYQLASEYIAHLNELFHGNLPYAETFIPNIVEYLTNNYRAVGGLCKPITRSVQHTEQQNILALVMHGKAHKIQGHFDEALRDLTRALELNPNHTTALISRGEIHANLDHYVEAFTDLNLHSMSKCTT